MVQENYLNGLTPSQKQSQLFVELEKTRAEKDKLADNVSSLEAKIKEIEESESKGSILIKTLNEEIEKYKLASGMINVYGPGVEITIDNPIADENSNSPYESNLVYDYGLILEMINELNASGAEAISINEQRILSTTEIRTAGDQININKVPQNVPFTIKAIGKSETLNNAINNRFGIVEDLRLRKYQVEVKIMEKITVPKYNGSIDFKYAVSSDTE